MKSVIILIDTIDKVRKFVYQISKIDGEFDIVSDRYIIDAKSIMGIYSLELSKPLKMLVHREEDMPAVLQELNEFIVE